MKHPVALNHHVGILRQVLCADRPEGALSRPEHDGDDVHAHLVDQARGKDLATDVAGGDLDDAVTREPLRLGHGRLDAVDEASPSDNQSSSGPGWSFSSATKPSTDTELYMTTLPTGLSSASGCTESACREPSLR